MMTPDEVTVTPHRRNLNRERIAELQRTARVHSMLGTGLGAAVAYRPSVGWVLVAGEHRWAALSAPGSKTEMIILASWEDLVAWMAIDMQDPRRTPWDPIAAVFFYEKAVAALKPNRLDSPLADVAEFTGIHRGVLESVRWARALIADEDEPKDVRDHAQLVLDELEQGRDGGHSIRDRVRRYRAARVNAGRPPQSAAVQRKSLGSVAEVEGIIAALADIGPINPEIPMQEREEYARRLGSLGVQISKIKKALRGEAS